LAREKPIVIQDYNVNWPTIFLAEKALVHSAMGDRLVAVEHIGSTAVPGLGAKPIVDILAGVRTLLDVDPCIDPLASVGYSFRTEALEDMPEDRYFEKWVDGVEVAHLHATGHLGRFWTERMLFRDFLRGHLEDAKEYEALKRQLAPQFTRGYTYAQAKTDFIHSALARARAETSRLG
jgi:GrpB-like predicted nucleotidyltransferase (UPF0157 family)